MKKLIAFLLTICLLMGVCSLALAAGPRITKQPESATTDEKGTVSFQIKATDYTGLTWRFLNPATGEETTGKKLSSIFKKIKVSSPNGPAITLKNVPDEMHGWYVYCHLTGNGYTVDSDQVRLLVNGLPDPDMETPSVPESESETVVELSPSETPEASETPEMTEVTLITETPAEPQSDVEVESLPITEAEAQPAAESEPQPAAEAEVQPEQPEEMHIDENGNLVAGAAEVVKTITIRAKDATLYPIDAYNNLRESEASAEFTFEGSADLAVRADGPVRYWLLNDMRLEPVESTTGFILRNVRDNLVITAVPASKTVQEIDETKLVTVTCEGCKFTWNKGGLKNVTSGNIPAGTEILIICNPAPDSGYSLNGGPFEDAGKVSVRRTITEDTVINVK